MPVDQKQAEAAAAVFAEAFAAAASAAMEKIAPGVKDADIPALLVPAWVCLLGVAAAECLGSGIPVDELHAAIAAVERKHREGASNG